MAMLNNQMVICPRFIKFDQLSQVDVPAQHLVADQMIKRAKAWWKSSAVPIDQPTGRWEWRQKLPSGKLT